LDEVDSREGREPYKGNKKTAMSSYTRSRRRGGSLRKVPEKPKPSSEKKISSRGEGKICGPSSGTSHNDCEASLTQTGLVLREGEQGIKRKCHARIPPTPLYTKKKKKKLSTDCSYSPHTGKEGLGGAEPSQPGRITAPRKQPSALYDEIGETASRKAAEAEHHGTQAKKKEKNIRAHSLKQKKIETTQVVWSKT